MDQLIGLPVDQAIQRIGDERIIEIVYIKGYNKNFNTGLIRPIVVRYNDVGDKHRLTIAYF
jgi:hypothetical protein